MQYTISKNFFREKDTEFLYVFFENGDYISLSGTELKAYAVNLYDKLVRYDNGFCAVAESGFIRLKIQNQVDFCYNGCFLHDPEAYEQDRKKYIENRCVNESRITEIRLFDRNHWHYTLLGNCRATMNGAYLQLEFVPQPQMGKASSTEHCVCLGDVKTEAVSHIDLDFENCESFYVYDKEISDIHLEFEKELEWGSDKLYRKIRGGYIKLKLRKCYNTRSNHLYDDKNLKKRDFERRLCGKKGFAHHDICHLYVHYNGTGFGASVSECIVPDDMKSDEDIDRLERKENETGNLCYRFESGYSKKLKDGTIILTFGKGAKRTLAKQELKVL